MAIPLTPAVADRAEYFNVTPVQSTALIAQLTANATNTATSATAVTGLSGTMNNIKAAGSYIRVTLSGDNVSNSGANSVVLTVWNGTVGSGTQVGGSTTIATGGKTPINFIWYVPITTSLIGTAPTINIGMHGSGAGTNTLAASSTAPCTMVIEVI